jgi:hypothetical protein
MMKDKVIKNLPFPKSKKNRTCGENVGVEWDCGCRMETEGMEIGK